VVITGTRSKRRSTGSSLRRMSFDSSAHSRSAMTCRLPVTRRPGFSSRAVAISLLAIVLIAFGGEPRTARADPLDQINQYITIDLDPVTTIVSIAMSGGIIANEAVLKQLDTNGDNVASPAEQQAWIKSWVENMHVSLDEHDVAIDPSTVALTLPSDLKDFYYALDPLVVSFPVHMPAQSGEKTHRLTVEDQFMLDWSTFQLDVNSRAGVDKTDQSWPGRTVNIAFDTNPALSTGSTNRATKAASEWSGNWIVDRANSLLRHKRTPLFIVVMLGVFVFLGAMHALQPGHGKTLVGAYLVATGGTPRDALALAGIVTLTHTLSVFALGAATLAASQLFLPSKVIPAMGVISGLIVLTMGFTMFRGALRRSRRNTMAPIAIPVEHHHDGGDDDAGHHHHDHAELSDEEHARLHLEEALAVRSGVSRKSLISLGVSGGLAPCPDALAILLLAIGIGQAEIGMVAIVAFSAGLAGVLIAFGLAFALAGPFWTKIRTQSEARPRVGAWLNRFIVYSPYVSASVVMALGLVIAWRSAVFG
jgi:nickel/cobalt transporter (NicO) family protein